MARGIALFAVLAALPALVAAQIPSGGLLEAFNGLPSCARGCLTSTISLTACNQFDFACMCSDQVFFEAAQECLLDACSTLDSLEVSRTVREACGMPRRNAKHRMLLALIAEVPAAFMPWLRLYTSWKLQTKIQLDDWLMTVGGVLYTAFLVVGAYVGQFAFGEDIWYTDPEVVTQGLKLFYIDQPFYLVCLCITKVSVLCFYIRIFTTQTFRRAAWATMAFIIIPTITILFLQIFQCRPIPTIWEGWLSKEWKHKCLDLNTLAYVAGSFSIAQDLLLILLPMPWLVSLKVSLKTKLGVMLMFSLGIFVLATSCARLAFIMKFGATLNPTWDYVDPLIWSGLEVAVSVIVACLPSLRLLILHYMPSIRSSSHSRSQTTGKSNKYGKLGPSSGSTGSRARCTKSGTVPSKGVSGNESQVELGMHPDFDNSYEVNGYRCKTPTEVKVAAAENTYEMMNRPLPTRGIMVRNELVVASEFNERSLSPHGR